MTIAVLGFVTHGRTDFPDEVIEGLGLTGRAADQVLGAVAEAEPEDAERGGRPDEQPGTPLCVHEG